VIISHPDGSAAKAPKEEINTLDFRFWRGGNDQSFHTSESQDSYAYRVLDNVRSRGCMNIQVPKVPEVYTGKFLSVDFVLGGTPLGNRGIGEVE
jgi:hypothetical protein